MAYVYFHPSSQFRPLRNAGAALNQTSMAAGISTQSQLVPAKSATTPNETNRIDQPIDFLEFALINSYPALVARLELSAFPVSTTSPHPIGGSSRTFFPDRAGSRCVRRPGRSS